MTRVSFIFLQSIVLFYLVGCKNSGECNTPGVTDSSLINFKHLDALYTPVTFANNVKAAGVYIYAEAPDYHLVGAKGEGFTCVDDVSRAALVYARSRNFESDSSIRNKLVNLVLFILEMQSENGYFYNFLLPGNIINKDGQTSVNTPNWWSWRALQTLTEVSPIVKKLDSSLSQKIDRAIAKAMVTLKSDLPISQLTTKEVNDITVPQWLPGGSATDQASILILALLNYCSRHENEELKIYIDKLAQGIAMMQKGDSLHFPFCCFLSWENVWHAYGADQAYALMKAGEFLNDSTYITKGLAEVDNFYPWLLEKGMMSSFAVIKKGNDFVPADQLGFPQIAYGIRPMIFAATEAYKLTGKPKYADIAAHLAAWFLGANTAKAIMYDKNTGRCFDGIISMNKVNRNSGAESTIEALLAFQRIEGYPEIILALNKINK